jgi:hypothetical protein
MKLNEENMKKVDQLSQLIIKQLHQYLASYTKEETIR